MQDVYKAIGRVSSTEATVLIRGESGTGKELVARAVYSHSLRADKPFQVINCVAIPESLLESELFGFEKGAFTGAAHRRVGKIEQAHGGTVFLDEIGDMPSVSNPRSCACCRRRASSGWAGGKRFRWTCGSLPPPTAILKPRCSAAAFAKICITA